jgi:hypothetical protein
VLLTSACCATAEKAHAIAIASESALRLCIV